MPHSKRTATGVLGGLLGLVGLSAVAGLLITATVTPAIAVSGYAASSAITMFDNMPSYLQPEKLMMPTEIYKKASDGSDVLMAEFYDQNRIPVTWEEVAPVMYDAILSSEDKNFYSHGGVDLLGTMKALVGNASSGSNRGGSSITQQYVKNVLQQNCEVTAKSQEEVQDCYRETTVSSGVEGYERKLQEMRYAIQLEQEVSKDDILLGYLNIAAFGGTTYGIGAAAERYFGVAAKDLTIVQAATIAGMVQEPNTLRIDLPDGTMTNKAGEAVNGAADGYSVTKERRDYVLGRMLTDGKITQAEYDEAIATPVTPNVTTRPVGCTQAVGAEFFCDYVRSIITTDPAFGETDADRAAALRRGGLKVYTTLDSDLQAAAVDAISVVPASVGYMNLGASGIQLEVGTGRVLSMVQNRGYDPAATEENAPTTAVNYNVRGINGGGGHAAGSTYKLFSLVNWLEQGHSVNEVINGRVGKKKVQTCDGATQTVDADNSGQAGHIGNFENNSGYSGTPYNFTRDSLNSGFFAMAEKISVCSTNRVAMKMGVVLGNDGGALDQTNLPYNVLGDQYVAPIDMAAAYATVAANGVLCQPKAIDRVVDRDGTEFTPERTCDRVISEAVAATAADTLVGVMSGTGIGARIGDGTPVFGKTGIHEYFHTWMDGSSTKVTTVVWVGNVKGEARLNEYRESGYQLSRIRNSIWPKMQGAANSKYGGDRFPEPAAELTKRVLTDLPSVIGQTVEQARSTLQAAGFSVNVADAADGVEAAGTIIAQDPGAGKAPGGATVTITPSNGSGVAVPGVSGTPQDAARQLAQAGFASVSAECTQGGDSDQGVVTGTNPAAGTITNRGTAITIQYQAKDCSRAGGGGGRGNG